MEPFDFEAAKIELSAQVRLLIDLDFVDLFNNMKFYKEMLSEIFDIL